MKALTRVIERLAELSRGDRDWLLRNLSEAAKESLRARAAEEREDDDGPERDPPAMRKRAAPDGADAAVTNERRLEFLPGDRVAEALAGDPPWLLAAVLGLRSWPWEVQALARASAVTRAEISRLRLGASRVSPAMRELLVQSLLEKVSAGDEPAMNGFERLLHTARLSERPHR